MNILRLFGLVVIACGAVPGLSSAQIAPSTPATLNTNATTDAGTDSRPALVTDDAGIWIAVWESDDTLGATVGSDFDILFARSTDNGDTWSAPAPLNTNAATDSGTDGSPSIATDGLGNWIAIWWSNDTLSGTIGSDRDVLFARSTDDGATWSAPQALNSNAATDSGNDFTSRSSIATNGTGAWIAVWQSTDSLGSTIGSDSDILFARSTNSGASWSTAQPLNSNAATDSGNDTAPAIAGNPSNVWCVVWQSDDTLGGAVGTDFDIFSSRSQDNGMNWSTLTPRNTNATTDTGDDYAPQIASNGDRDWVMVWQSTDSLNGTIGTDADILVMSSISNASTWNHAEPLNSNAATDTAFDGAPSIGTDRNRNWIATWESSDTLSGTIGTDLDILYALSVDGGASWGTSSSMNTLATADSAADTSPVIVAGADDRWLAVWYSDNTLSGIAGSDFDLLVTDFDLPPALPIGNTAHLLMLALLLCAGACGAFARRPKPPRQKITR